MPDLRFSATRVAFPDLRFDAARPSAVVYLCAYGDAYIDRFLDTCVRSHLAPKNLPWLGRNAQVAYVIATRDRDVDRIRRHPTRARLAEHAAVLETVVAGADPNAITLSEAADAFFAVANHLRPTDPDATYLILSPDSLWADGAFQLAYRMVRSGAAAVLVPHFMRVVAEDAFAEVGGSGPIRITPRGMAALAARHTHPETELYRVAPHRRLAGEYQSSAFIEIPGEGFAARSSALHPLAVRPVGEFTKSVGTLESLVDALPPAWAAVRVVTGRLLHVDCAPLGVPRNAAARPFRFDDLGWYHARGAPGPISRHLWKFDLKLGTVPASRRNPEAWTAASDALESLMERAILYGRVEAAEFNLCGHLDFLRRHIDTQFQAVFAGIASLAAQLDRKPWWRRALGRMKRAIKG